jgi:hypothetical protein
VLIDSIRSGCLFLEEKGVHCEPRPLCRGWGKLKKQLSFVSRVLYLDSGGLPRFWNSKPDLAAQSQRSENLSVH